MQERFAVPCVGAIIERKEDGKTFLLVQTRQKADGGETNGLLELPAGKIRAYEDIFSALRREVQEETGLILTRIWGEEAAVWRRTGDVKTLSFEPFCVTQNLSGGYSILLSTFLCEAQGEPVDSTEESSGICWMESNELLRRLRERPETIFWMHRNALEKYFEMGQREAKV